MMPTVALFALLLAPEVGAAPSTATPAVAPPAVSRFSINTRYVFSVMPKTLTDIKVWFPIPFEDEQQKVHNRFISAPYNVETAALSDTGTTMGYMVGGPRGGLPMQVRVSFDLERFSDARGRQKAATPPLTPEMFRALSQRWLKDESLSLPDARVKDVARKATSGRKSPMEKARGIFDHVVSKFTLLQHPKELQGAGYGRVAFTVKEGKGDRTDLAAAFVGLCRAAGIPARIVVGLRFPAGEKTGVVHDWHLWAEFLTQEQGWVPADPVAAIQEPARRDFYFGSLDPDRLAISIGRDVVLIPAQGGPPLNFFINPYWEGNGKEMPAPYVEAEFTRIDTIQKNFGVPSPTPTPAATPTLAEPARPPGGRR